MTEIPPEFDDPPFDPGVSVSPHAATAPEVELVQITLTVSSLTPPEQVATEAVAAFTAATPAPPAPVPPEPGPGPGPGPGDPRPATGAEAGLPGHWGFSDDGSGFNPSDLAIPPKTPTALRADDPVRVFPFPAERWQPGEWVQTANQTQSGWAWFDGDTWRSGKTPA